MPSPILDKYASLPISRQARYQLRQRARRRCPICGARARGGYYCPAHAQMKRLRQNALNRRRRQIVRRNGGKIHP